MTCGVPDPTDCRKLAQVVVFVVGHSRRAKSCGTVTVVGPFPALSRFTARTCTSALPSAPATTRAAFAVSAAS